MDIYIVETRTLQVAQKYEKYVACEPVYHASSQDRAEIWMQDQCPGDKERYYYCLMKTELDIDRDFEVVGYYNLLGERTTKQRCIDFILLTK